MSVDTSTWNHYPDPRGAGTVAHGKPLCGSDSPRVGGGIIDCPDCRTLVLTPGVVHQ